MQGMFLILALAVFFLHWGFTKQRPRNTLEILLGYLMLFAFGCSGIGNFLGQIFYSQKVANFLNWPWPSPFQFQVGIAHLSMGVIAILSFWMRKSFLNAALLANTIWFWGDAWAQIRYTLMENGGISSEAGAYVAIEILIPLFVWAIYIQREKTKKS